MGIESKVCGVTFENLQKWDFGKMNSLLVRDVGKITQPQMTSQNDNAGMPCLRWHFCDKLTIHFLAKNNPFAFC